MYHMISAPGPAFHRQRQRPKELEAASQLPTQSPGVQCRSQADLRRSQGGKGVPKGGLNSHVFATRNGIYIYI